MPPGSVRGTFMRFNPLFHMVEVIRAPILGEAIELTTYYYIGTMTVLGWAIAALLYRRYARFVPLWI
jgi:ABC-2 type transport system permease protein/lipopolysaccharide transport system permease protein